MFLFVKMSALTYKDVLKKNRCDFQRRLFDLFVCSNKTMYPGVMSEQIRHFLFFSPVSFINSLQETLLQYIQWYLSKRLIEKESGRNNKFWPIFSDSCTFIHMANNTREFLIMVLRVNDQFLFIKMQCKMYRTYCLQFLCKWKTDLKTAIIFNRN